jgi:hypothetical protein
MFVGHFAAAFVARSIEPKLSLGTLVAAAMLPDILWPIFTMAGLEYQTRVEETPGQVFAVPISHSLLMVAIYGALLAIGYFLLRKNRRAALVLFAVVLSHWLLDAIAHKHTLAPGTQKYFGLELWHHFLSTILVEGGFWLFAIILYIRATRPVKRAGIFAFWPVVAFFTFAWVSNIRKGPPPPEAVLGSLIFFALAVAWAYWMNRVRPDQEKGRGDEGMKG